MDNELHELCEEVYELTEWGDNALQLGHTPNHEDIFPLYTSDYLLEKLPNGVAVSNANGRWGAWVVLQEDDLEEADTPLKALLKLVLALEKAGEL